MKAKAILGEIDNFIEKISFFPRFSILLFIAGAGLCYYMFTYSDVVNRRPQSVHQWRQADCLSMTMNYYKEDRPFFEPALHFLSIDGTGQTISEFPIIYYTVSRLWKVFGHHEYIYRFFTLGFFLCGLFALFKTSEWLLKDTLWAFFTTFLVLCAPYLSYYAFNFLVDIPALSTAMIAWFWFARYWRKRNNIDFFICLFFFFMAGLIKISSALSFFGLLGVLFFDTISKNGTTKFCVEDCKQ